MNFTDRVAVLPTGEDHRTEYILTGFFVFPGLQALLNHHLLIFYLGEELRVHRIHLRGPWEFEVLSGFSLQQDVPPEQADADRVPKKSAEKNAPLSPNPSPDRITMPVDWQKLFGPSQGTVLFRRRFHCPTHLDENERVDIVFDGVGGRGCVRLNGTLLGRLFSAHHPQRFEITPLLKPFNELVVELEYDGRKSDSPGGLYAPVALEITSVEAPTASSTRKAAAKREPPPATEPAD